MVKFARKPLLRCFEGVDRVNRQEKHDVTFTYHTYRGLLIWCIQDQHIVHAPYMDAKMILKRLLIFNLTWGLLSYGLIFIPFVAVGNYRSQLGSIRQQAEAINRG